MTIESGGNPNALSKAGAIGLLQIMPIHSCVSWKPEQNISCGVGIIAGHYHTIGNWKDALAQYNAGVTGASRGSGYDYAIKVLDLYNDSRK